MPYFCGLQRCVICQQSHGSCTQCCKCATYFHVMCASRAGYSMEVSFHSSYEQANALYETPNVDLCCPVLVLALHVCMMHAFIFKLFYVSF
jgi:hypothetical protein